MKRVTFHVPDDWYERIETLANAKHKSGSVQVMLLLLIESALLEEYHCVEFSDDEPSEAMRGWREETSYWASARMPRGKSGLLLEESQAARLPVEVQDC